MSDLERREREEPEKEEKAGEYAYLYLALGVGLLIATALIIATTGAPVSGLGFVIGAAALLGLGVNELRKQRVALPKPLSHERELLSAIRENGGSITPAEAAMATSLTVREADAMLSELASGGHLAVESDGGSLVYSLPKRRRNREIE
ncbi:MAG: hypothetical protein ACR2N0_09640 [Rubrobacteraceae bacterium]